MKKISKLANASATGLLAAIVIAVPAYACHPQGVIVKSVQDQTTGIAASDANTASSAISVAHGDTLVYSITVSNKGAAASNGDNDMSSVTLTDTLPDGIALASAPSQRTISEDLGTIQPGKSITKTYAVTVTDSTDGDVITNKACYTGNSKDNKANQSGCDVAIVKVHVPTTPTPPPTPTVPTTLPDTGSTSSTAAWIVLGSLVAGYAVNTLRLRRHTNS